LASNKILLLLLVPWSSAKIYFPISTSFCFLKIILSSKMPIF
jgi:hypothetical protein